MKKISLKNKQIYKIETRAWLPGDLVKIKSSTWSGRAHSSIGFVIHETNDMNLKLFPAVVVYDIHLKESREFYLYDLELISAAM